MSEWAEYFWMGFWLFVGFMWIPALAALLVWFLRREWRMYKRYRDG